MSSSTEAALVDVVQDGARLHYAAPVALRRAGLLGRVFTDWFVRKGSAEGRIAAMVARLDPAAGARMAERTCSELEDAAVVTSVALSLRHALGARLHASRSAAFEAESAANARRIIRCGLPERGALLAFARNLHPDLAAAAQKSCGRLVVDQMIAPAVTEARAIRRAAMAWPKWRSAAAAGEDAVARRMEEGAWPSAARIACPSPYVRDALIAQGLDPSKLVLAPYPIDARAMPAPDRLGRRSKPIIGFVGSVGLRKGAPVFAEIARRFGARARFVMVGPIESRTAADALAGAGVALTGPVPRSAVAGWLAEFDAFLFPSFCEGSAGAVMEAMASGLPVVVTPSSGSAAIDGIDGFVRDCEDVDGLASAVGRLIEDDALRARMGAAARRRALTLDVDGYARTLAELFRGLGLASAHSRGDQPQQRAV